MKLLTTTIAAVLVVGCGPSEAELALMDAAYDGNIEAVKQHLAAGADVNAKDDDGETPLHAAASWGHKEVAELLISKGADVNAKDEDGVTPLHWTETEEIAELLIAAGADVNAKSNSGRTPLDLAIRGNVTGTADLLRKHGGKTGTIHVVARNGDLAGVQAHLDAGVDVNAKNVDGWTPLHEAALKGHKEIAELLIARGADVNAKQKYGETPLHMAALSGHKEIAELLIAKGADVNGKDEFGKTTPLDTAIRRKHPETADLLRKHGGKRGAEFSIHVASGVGNIEAVKQHLAAGTDVNARNKYGSTPLDLAIHNDETETADLLRKHGGKTGEELKAEGK